MDFPLIDLMDERACYEKLLALLHPDGLACPRCGASDRMGIHRRHRDPVLDYQCGHCGFKARQYYWHCPGCSKWESYPPRRTEELNVMN